MQKCIAKDIVKVVLEQTVIEVGYDHIYAILADECTDMEDMKLMTIVIQYVIYLSGDLLE